jgi:hypothetical protein
MDAFTLAALDNLPLVLSVRGASPASFAPNAHFTLPLLLSSYSAAALTWAETQPLRLSYRWYDEDGNRIAHEGLRTMLPVSGLEPGSTLEVDLVGTTPHDEGRHILRVSAVLEGVHWACDVDSDAWLDVEVSLASPVPWPAELSSSQGARAIRGAIAAAALARALHGRTLVVDAASAAVGREAHYAEARVGRVSWPNGPPGLPSAATGPHPDIDQILEFACRQERRIADLLATIGEQDRRIEELNGRRNVDSAAKADIREAIDVAVGSLREAIGDRLESLEAALSRIELSDRLAPLPRVEQPREAGPKDEHEQHPRTSG